MMNLMKLCVPKYKDNNPRSFLYLVHVGREKDDLCPPIIIPVLAIHGDLEPEKIFHQREGEHCLKFTDEYRFVSPYPNSPQHFHRPVYTTLASNSSKSRITSFVVDTGSPFTFLAHRVIEDLSLIEVGIDVYGYAVYKCTIQGREVKVRESYAHWKDVNLLGNDFMYKCASLKLSYPNKSIHFEDL